MKGKELAELPKCDIEDHGYMGLRDPKGYTYEEKYCGVWYDCKYPGCKCSTLLMSQELKGIYDKGLVR